MPGGQRRLKGALAFGLFGQGGARLVLALASAHGGAHQADQRGGMKRPLQKRHIAEQLCQTRRRRIALRPAALARQQDDREIGPGRLIGQRLGQNPQIGGHHRFVRDNCQARAAGDLRAKGLEIGMNLRRKTRLAQDRQGDGAIAARGGQDQRAFGKGCRFAHFALLCRSAGGP